MKYYSFDARYIMFYNHKNRMLDNDYNNYFESMSGGSNKFDQYIDLRSNGKLFPTWVLQNFKNYKLPEIMRKEGDDPCNVATKLELRKYQEFIGKYIGPDSPYNEILLYHGLGSGKTATSINLMNIVYNYNPNSNLVILTKASLREDPWINEMRVWLGRDPDEEKIDDIKKLKRFNSLHFIHYDSPFADRDFMELMKKIDTSKPTLYIIDEAHNFIRNVYSNINSKSGKRAQVIYDSLLTEKKENKSTKIVLISATPGINTPFELALMFNLLRPGIFPSVESVFNTEFVAGTTYPIINPVKKNMFQRRIMGLVSYYVGATPDLYATQYLNIVDLPMSKYQYEIYRHFEKLEAEIQKKAMKSGRSSQLYSTYTRQACNFVFPMVNANIGGITRPRPSSFGINDKISEDFLKGKTINDAQSAIDLNKYYAAINTFLKETEKYFVSIDNDDKKNKHTLKDDLENFKNGLEKDYDNKFINFLNSKKRKSKLFQELYDSSPKMTAILFMTYVSPGKVMIYSNYVVMEGIDIMKIYLRMGGYNDYLSAKDYFGYCEYHGRIDQKDRIKIKQYYNTKDNIRGEKCKIILLSPSATEGIQLRDMRQEHILEPYWTEVRISQVIGRGVRQCSHKDLPIPDRTISIYRYKVIKPLDLASDDTERYSTDEKVEDRAKAKDNLIQSFLTSMKEAAVDCELFKAHNMMAQSYNCFRFPDEDIIGKRLGPAFKDDIKDDTKYDSGTYSKGSRIERIKVIKIKGVFRISEDEMSAVSDFWYNPNTGIVYDYDMHFPVGKISYINSLPNKLDKDTYIIENKVDIPIIK